MNRCVFVCVYVRACVVGGERTRESEQMRDVRVEIGMGIEGNGRHRTEKTTQASFAAVPNKSGQARTQTHTHTHTRTHVHTHTRTHAHTHTH